MAEFHAELLVAARRLLARRAGQRGPLPSAHVRRSISTSYYALFHFLLSEVAISTVGASSDLRRRRRMLGRTVAHKTLRVTFERVKGRTVEASVEDFLRSPGLQGPVVTPPFVRTLADVFADAYAKRHDADYDLNKTFSEGEARLLRTNVLRSISVWQTARTPADRDFKHALSLLIILRGQLRAET